MGVILMLEFPVCWYDDTIEIIIIIIIIIIIMCDYFQFGGCNTNLRAVVMFVTVKL
jgi:hypothetical protein